MYDMMQTRPSDPADRYRVAAMFGTEWVRARIRDALDHAGMALDSHPTPRSFLAALQDGSADVGIMEDSGSAQQACLASLRFQGASAVPIIVVGDGSMRQMVSALRGGASDYAAHDEPLDRLVSRLCARIEASRGTQAGRVVDVGDCSLDADTRVLSGPLGSAALTPREFGLAWLLFEHAGRVVHVRTLSAQVWGRDPSLTKRSMEQHACMLRRKLRKAGGASAPQVHAINGIGYRLAQPAALHDD
jgi:DNA-binding response OmpR family regulator